MSDGFPVPDFDFDDVAGEAPVLEMIPSSAHTLSHEELAAFESQLSASILTDSPIRWTGNSVVYIAQTESGDRFAVKITNHKRRVAEEYAKRGLLPDSQFLVRTLGYFEIPTKSLLLMELCADGDISRRNISSDAELRALIFGVACALDIVHSSGWMHLDVSPGNILVAGDTFKLADFGTLTRVGEFAEGCEGAGPYVSPEALAFPCGQFEVGPPTDIFSFGVVLLESATGVLAPRGGCDGYVKLRRGTLRLGNAPYTSQFDGRIQALINAMLDPDPRQRPSARQIAELISVM